MCTAAEMLRRANTIDIEQQAGEVVDEHQQEYLQLIKEQLHEGKSKEGTTINPVYKADNYSNRRYAIKKYVENSTPGYGNPDLYLSGNLYNALKMARSKNELVITSGVDYFQFIDKRYGDTPFGLDDDSKEIYRDTVLYPALQRRVNLILTGF